MRKIGALAVLVVALAAPAQALPAGALVTATRVARTYWHGNPACGSPGVTEAARLPDPAEIGGAVPARCTIELLAGMPWRANPGLLCTVIAHEWGHLVLGFNAFASVNPGDPAHSPDPASIMYRAPGAFAPCVRAMR